MKGGADIRKITGAKNDQKKELQKLDKSYNKKKKSLLKNRTKAENKINTRYNKEKETGAKKYASQSNKMNNSHQEQKQSYNNLSTQSAAAHAAMKKDANARKNEISHTSSKHVAEQKKLLDKKHQAGNNLLAKENSHESNARRLNKKIDVRKNNLDMMSPELKKNSKSKISQLSNQKKSELKQASQAKKQRKKLVSNSNSNIRKLVKQQSKEKKKLSSKQSKRLDKTTKEHEQKVKKAKSKSRKIRSKR